LTSKASGRFEYDFKVALPASWLRGGLGGVGVVESGGDFGSGIGFGCAGLGRGGEEEGER